MSVYSELQSSQYGLLFSLALSTNFTPKQRVFVQAWEADSHILSLYAIHQPDTWPTVSETIKCYQFKSLEQRHVGQLTITTITQFSLGSSVSSKVFSDSFK